MLKRDLYILFMLFLLIFTGCSPKSGEVNRGMLSGKKEPQLCETPYFYEDFSNIPNETLPPGWIGGGFMVVRNGKLVPQAESIQGCSDWGCPYSFLIPQIEYPENFILEIDLNTDNTSNSTVFSIGNLDFGLGHHEENYAKQGYFIDNNFVKYEWGRATEYHFVIKIEKRNDIFKYYINGKEYQIVRKPDFKRSNIFSFRHRPVPSRSPHRFSINKITLCSLDDNNSSPIDLIMPSTFINEQFSNVEDGMLPAGWIGGKNLAVTNSNRLSRHKVLGKLEAKGEFDVTIPNINFPDDFKVDILMLYGGANDVEFDVQMGNLTLQINEGKKSKLGDTEFKLSSNLLIRWDDNRPVFFQDQLVILTIEKRKELFRLYVNGKQYAMTRKVDFTSDNTISISSPKDMSIGSKTYPRNLAIYSIVGSFLE